MTKVNIYPERDSLEGSHATVECDPKRQGDKRKRAADREVAQKGEPGSEAAEPSPE